MPAIEPNVGRLSFWALRQWLSDYGTWCLIGLGLLAIVITINFKQGLAGWAAQRFGLELLPTRRRPILRDTGD